MRDPLDELGAERAPSGMIDQALGRYAERAQGRRRRQGQVRVALVALAVGVACGWVARGTGSEPAEPVTPLVVASEIDRVPVRFVFHAADADRVTIAGTFNEWDSDSIPMIRGDDGVFHAVLSLPPGRHEYMFVVDGTRWVVDPTAPLSTEDGFGRRNAVLEITACTAPRSRGA